MLILLLHWLFLTRSQFNVTPPMTVVCSGISTTTTTITIALTPMALATALDQNDVVLLPQLILTDRMIGIVGLTNMPCQQPQSQKAYTSYVVGSPQVHFHHQR